ncbi:MAG: PKD domain-containing protein [Bacteroidales bacterium]
MKNRLKILLHVVILILICTSCKKDEPNDPFAPQACFTVPTGISAGIPATFNSSCSENVTSFYWNFGDGGTSTDVNPVHTFSEAGSFSVRLTVSDDEGGTDEMTISVVVMAPEFIEHSGNITSDQTWIEGVHIITGDVHVDGATLTIEPGAIIKFNAGMALYIGYHSGNAGATLIANGTADKMITFTSSASLKSAGDWDYIWFDEGASKISSMQYCVVEYGGGYSNNYGAIHIGASAVSIDHSLIKLSESHGISLDAEGYFASFSNNRAEQNNSSAISIYGNYTHTIGEDNTLESEKGIIVRTDNLEEASVTWLKQSTAYVIEGDLYVGSSSGTSLIIAPGAEIRMGSGSAIYFGYRNGTFGTLTAEGTEEERIKITSNAPAVSKSAGDWDYLWFDNGAGTNSKFAFCDIEYGGGYSANYGMIYVAESGISVTNSTISHSESQGIAMDDQARFTECSDNVFDNNGTYPIELYGNYAHTIGAGNSFNTGSGILVRGDRIEQSEVTWLKQEVPYIVNGGLDLGSTSGSKLTIEPGSNVNFTSGSSLRIGYFDGTFGILEARGESGNMITFSSSAPSGLGSPGDWNGIWFYDGTTNGNILDYCIISYGGGYSSNSGNLNFYNETVAVPVISNCQVSNSAAWGFYLSTNSNPTLSENTFENNALGEINP